MVRAPLFRWREFGVNLLRDGGLRRALGLASGDLFAALEGKGFDWDLLSDRERFAVWKYLNRSCFRAVPFGGFASFGMMGDGEMVWHSERDGVVDEPLVRPLDGDLLVFVNPGLYELGRWFRFLVTLRDGKGRCSYRVDALEADDFHRGVLKFVGEGCLVRELADYLVKEWDCGMEEAAELVFFLVEDQVLLSGLSPVLIGPPLGGSGYGALERPMVGKIDAGLAGVLPLLGRLVGFRESERLSSFKRDFVRRFERQRVPLLLALDADAGIGFGGVETSGADISEGLPFVSSSAERRVVWDGLPELLLRLWPKNGALVIREEDLKNDLASVPVVVPVLYRDTVAGLVIDQAGGACPVSLMGRFGLFSDAVWESCKELVAFECANSPDVVFADISLLYDAHTDNINRRRQIYDHTVGVNTVGDLPVSDLMVLVQDGEIILESVRLGRRVIPRLSTAFNFRHAELPVFQFLCELAYQGLQRFDFDISGILPGLAYYPRVVLEDVIISPATWYLDSWIEGLPDRVCLGDSDQQLVFDLRNEVERGYFVSMLKKRTRVQEFLEPVGEYASQYLGFFTNSEAKPYAAAKKIVVDKTRRDFMIGSDWVFLKVFCSVSVADEVLQEVVAPLVAKYKGELRCWFFIRYNEDGHHLRLRFRLKMNTGLFLKAFERAMVRAGLAEQVRSVEMAAYSRELERYGLGLMERVETVFRLGSEAALVCEEPIAHMLAIILAFEVDALAFCTGARDGFFAELKGDKALKVAMDMEYRKVKINLYFEKTLQPLFLGCQALAKVVKTEQKQRLLSDLVHMQLCRLLSTNERRQEMMYYHFLVKALSARAAQEKPRGKTGR